MHLNIFSNSLLDFLNCFVQLPNFFYCGSSFSNTKRPWKEEYSLIYTEQLCYLKNINEHSAMKIIFMQEDCTYRCIHRQVHMSFSLLVSSPWWNMEIWDTVKDIENTKLSKSLWEIKSKQNRGELSKQTNQNKTIWFEWEFPTSSKLIYPCLHFAL